jgi:DNA-directed RNA polymerase subunit RPC12/RpoP
MRCPNCKSKRFKAFYTQKVNVAAVFDEHGAMIEVIGVGDPFDIERKFSTVCAECGTELDDDDWDVD